MNRGLELADSYATNPHKWLLTNFDCDAFYVADRAALTDGAGAEPRVPAQRRESEAGAVIDYRDWHIPLGRRFRALKLWVGAAPLRRRRTGRTRPRRRPRWRTGSPTGLAADPRFTVTSTSLSLVCFRLDDSVATDDLAADVATEQLLAAVNDTGRAYLSHTVVGGRYVIRLAVGTPTTTDRHIDDLLALLFELA